jgi:antitoxin (DNA-binding transcriptional repressor) of toxin-antitoxin stability system
MPCPGRWVTLPAPTGTVRVVTAAHAYEFEVPPHGVAPADAVNAAEGGQVVYLTRRGRPVAAVVPPEVAAAGYAAVTALEDAADLRAARDALADPAPSVPLDEVLARYAADLDNAE